MKELVELITKALVDYPEGVQVRAVEGSQATVLELRTHPEDLGKVIGRQGRTAKAIRTLFMSCPLCAPGNQAQFVAEMDIHLSGLKNVNKPSVLLFSNILVRKDCGCSRMTIPRAKLALLAKGLATSEG